MALFTSCLSTAILIAILRLFGFIFPKLYRKVDSWRGTLIPSLRIQRFELLPAEPNCRLRHRNRQAAAFLSGSGRFVFLRIAGAGFLSLDQWLCSNSCRLCAFSIEAGQRRGDRLPAQCVLHRGHRHHIFLCDEVRPHHLHRDRQTNDRPSGASIRSGRSRPTRLSAS